MESDGAIYFDIMTLTFQGHDLCKLIFWTISQLLMGKTLPNFNVKLLAVKAFK